MLSLTSLSRPTGEAGGTHPHQNRRVNKGDSTVQSTVNDSAKGVKASPAPGPGQGNPRSLAAVLRPQC